MSAGTVERESAVTLAIGGMTCGACAARVERRLNRIDGVSASVNLATERARVVAPGDLDVADLVVAVESAGYSATPVEPGESPDEQVAELDARVRDLGRRLLVSAVLFMPVGDLSLIFWLFPHWRFAGWQALLTALTAPIVTWCAWPFYRAAWRHARHRGVSMDTLVSVGVVASTAWSLYAMYWLDRGRSGANASLHHLPGGAIYLDVAATVVTFLLAGRLFEAIARRRSGGALRALASVAAKDVSLLGPDGVEHRVAAAALEAGDLFVVRPGETVATDGVVESGRCEVDASAMTGESVPVEVAVGDAVVGGTVAAGGRVVVRATRVGRDTQLARMIALVEEAQSQKAGAQRFADRVAAYFVPGVVVVAAATLAVWLGSGASVERAMSATLAVLIIACPCALGLATPTALFVASGRAAQLGVFYKGYPALEATRQVDTVVLDKTGTLTEGRLEVVDARAATGSADDLLALAGAVESHSEHAVGRALARRAAGLGPLLDVEGFQARPGSGVSGTVGASTVEVGRPDGVGEWPADLCDAPGAWARDGRTVVAVRVDGALRGAIALADTPRPDAAAAVAELRAMGLRVLMVTGDQRATALAVAAALGVAEVEAEVDPIGKVEVVRRLQAEGRSVAVVGDGVNDAPALASADLGVAVGAGTDVAINAAGVVIVRDDLTAVAQSIRLSRRTLATIRGNLVWAFAYNTAAIPLAAAGLMNPLIAAAAMALSSAFVVWNSSRLRHAGGPGATAPAPAPAATTAATPAVRV